MLPWYLYIEDQEISTMNWAPTPLNDWDIHLHTGLRFNQGVYFLLTCLTCVLQFHQEVWGTSWNNYGDEVSWKSCFGALEQCRKFACLESEIMRIKPVAHLACKDVSKYILWNHQGSCGRETITSAKTRTTPCFFRTARSDHRVYCRNICLIRVMLRHFRCNGKCFLSWQHVSFKWDCLLQNCRYVHSWSIHTVVYVSLITWSSTEALQLTTYHYMSGNEHH